MHQSSSIKFNQVRSINQSTNQPTNQSINQSLNQWILIISATTHVKQGHGMDGMD